MNFHPPHYRLVRQQHDWEDLAALDPLWSIVSDPATRFGHWNRDAFFATGEREIAQVVIEWAAGAGFPLHREAALDFGCGVGRLTRALARHFTACWGVDISPTMIRLASELNEDYRHCRFSVNNSDDLGAFADESFDLVYSNVVLQHIPDRAVIRTYIREFVRVLRPGGLIVFQIPGWLPWRTRLQLRARLYRLLRRLGIARDLLYRRLDLHPITMTAMARQEVLAVLEQAGARVVSVEPTHQRLAYYATRVGNGPLASGLRQCGSS